MRQHNTAVRKKRMKQKAYILFYLYLLIVLMSLFVVASYTWLSLSRTPRVSNLKMYITSQSGLELSMDPSAEKWELQLSFQDMVSETTPLRPVTWSEANQRFVAAAYGIDGRLLNYDSWHMLSDESNANRADAYGYYVKTVFYARCGQKTNVTLTPAVAVEADRGIDGSGTYVMGVPVWNPGHYEEIEDENGEIQTVLVGMGHDNGGQGAENAIRLGFRTTYVNAAGIPVENPRVPTQFFIYEPNCDLHADGSTGYVPTPSIDGTDTLIGAKYLIRQTASTWTDTDPIENGVVVQSLGELIDDTTLFSLNPGEIVRIELYIWLEGQDMDCTNQSSNAQIQANIQFAGSSEDQTGMVKIEG